MEASVEYSIEVKNLTKRFGSITAINDVSFSLKKGEIVGFLGPNGAGKSTTMKILTGLLEANSGSAYICGIPVASHPEEIKRKIGYMPENNPLPVDMRVGEYLRFRGKLKEIPRRILKKRIDYVLELCDLTRAKRRIINGLSKGFRQRIGIAEAILSEPEVIIMDEPTIGLDPHQILKIRDLISSLRGRMSVIISSHILPEIELTCDRVIIINRGYVVASGTAAELRKEFLPENSYHIELSGNLEELGVALSSIHKELHITGHEQSPCNTFIKAIVSCPVELELGEELITSLGKFAKLKVKSIFKHTPTLEDIFLSATKRSWELVTGETAPPFPENQQAIEEEEPETKPEETEPKSEADAEKKPKEKE